MLTVGDKFPQFKLKATVSIESLENAFAEIDNHTYKGKWTLVFFYPKDFTFVCPTEIKGFGDLNTQFADRDCQVLAASTDSEFVHLAWRKDHKDLRTCRSRCWPTPPSACRPRSASSMRKKASPSARRSWSIRKA